MILLHVLIFLYHLHLGYKFVYLGITTHLNQWCGLLTGTHMNLSGISLVHCQTQSPIQ